MVERVLVAFDGSAEAAAAAELAFAIAAGCGARVTVAGVDEPRRASGEVCERLLAACASERADLVAAGAHDLGGLRGMVTVSVSRCLLERAPCPVLLVRRRAPDRASPKVLVGVEEPELSSAVLEAAQEMAAALYACLVLVHVADPSIPYMGSEAFTGVRGAVRERGEELLHRTRERIVAPIESVVAEVREGRPREQLVAACAEHRPLVAVVGTRAAGRLRRLWTGRSAREILDRAGCPVLAVGPAVERQSSEITTATASATTRNAIVARAARRATPCRSVGRAARSGSG